MITWVTLEMRRAMKSINLLRKKELMILPSVLAPRLPCIANTMKSFIIYTIKGTKLETLLEEKHAKGGRENLEEFFYGIFLSFYGLN